MKINTSVDYIESENIGYGRANNIAIKKYAGQAEYFIIMNPDIKFDVDSLEKLINFADEKKNFGIIDYVDKMKIATTANSGFALCGQFGSLANLSYF